MRIAMIGATGLVGSRLVPLLGDHELLLLGRRPSEHRGVLEKIAPAEAWPLLLAGERIDAAVSTLGSTWRKAGSWPAFEAIDRHAVVAFAKAAKAAGARRMLSVSSVGADPASRIDYLALKGRTDADLEQIDFDRLDLFRPGLLCGPRGGDRRIKERLGIALSPLTNLFVPDRFKAIDAALVARAMAAALEAPGHGVAVHSNAGIRALAGA